MEPLWIVVRIVAGLALILANAFFVAIEFALTRARQYPESEFAEAGLQRAWDMTDDLEIYLTSCQVGITASSIAVGIVAEPALAAIFEPLFANTALASVGAGAVIAFLIINLVHLTHGEQTPTYLGVERSKTVCRYGAAPLYWFTYIISPIISVGDTVAKWTLGLMGVEMTGAWLETEADVIESRAELRNKLGEVLEQGDLPEERRGEVMNALDIGETPVADVMVPREEIVALSTAADPEENIRRVNESPHTRFPLVGDSLDDFRGIVYVPELTRQWEQLGKGEVDLEEVAYQPMVVDADESVSDAVDQFQEAGQELALVRDGEETVGLVTTTDTVEEVMGELRDPLDEQYGSNQV
ncbi:Hemolysin, contains CBS domains [Natronoarchaeum philippinense]|uniref:Hemolysin, contains CBS domains n=1 Tax=Natronoarchaeum philippinense TaxID=558529 RepID=A0A285NT94_NATPI|nr:hemolysin family protein [Natronoarchaeum philippinense]SNZ12143.1 Hemolysin, contains CBS domains [Natronoarchaeum philippinense]